MTTIVVGAGPTGLAAAAGAASRQDQVIILEAQDHSGGLAASYRRNGYIFDRTGSMWALNAAENHPMLRLLREHTGGVDARVGIGGAYIAEEELLLPTPIAYHLHHFGSVRAKRYAQDFIDGAKFRYEPGMSWEDFLAGKVGRELYRLFFEPVYTRLTGGLLRQIAPPNKRLSWDPNRVIEGRDHEDKANLRDSYNLKFPLRPGGWGLAWMRFANSLDVKTGSPVHRITTPSVHPGEFTVHTPRMSYSASNVFLAVELPTALELVEGIGPSTPPPSTNVIVVSIGGKAGPKLPKPPYAWVGTPDSKSGFERVDITSNIDSSRAPHQDGVAMSVRIGLPPGQNKDPQAVCRMTVDELKSWGWVEDVEYVDPILLPGAYHWKWAKDDGWVKNSLFSLEHRGLLPVGSRARWSFETEGMLADTKDALALGAAVRAGKL